MENDSTKLGKCCICVEENERGRNLMTLDVKTVPGEKGGWGCFQCERAAEGAVAVLCDACLDKYFNKEVEIKFACVGFPQDNRRIEIEKLTESFEHDMSKHPEAAEQEDIPISVIEPLENFDIVFCQNCQEIRAVVGGKCAACGEEVCLICGCTSAEPCLEGCSWARRGVCSECADESILSEPNFDLMHGL